MATGAANGLRGGQGPLPADNLFSECQEAALPWPQSYRDNFHTPRWALTWPSAPRPYPAHPDSQSGDVGGGLLYALPPPPPNFWAPPSVGVPLPQVRGSPQVCPLGPLVGPFRPRRNPSFRWPGGSVSRRTPGTVLGTVLGAKLHPSTPGRHPPARGRCGDGGGGAGPSPPPAHLSPSAVG